jgi:short chain dehydrogenase
MRAEQVSLGYDAELLYAPIERERLGRRHEGQDGGGHGRDCRYRASHTAAARARLGASVVLTGRDERRGHSAVGDLRASAAHDGVRFAQADHATIAGNRELAQRIAARLPVLDVPVNNVGVPRRPRGRRRPRTTISPSRSAS